MELKFDNLELESLEVSEVEVLSLEDSMGMADGQASVVPSAVSCTASVIATSTSSI